MKRTRRGARAVFIGPVVVCLLSSVWVSACRPSSTAVSRPQPRPPGGAGPEARVPGEGAADPRSRAREQLKAKAAPVTGGERVEWDQAGPSLEQVRGYRFVAYVNGLRRDLTGVRCDAHEGEPRRFTCRAELPDLPDGLVFLRIGAVSTGDRGVLGPLSRQILLFKSTGDDGPDAARR